MKIKFSADKLVMLWTVLCLLVLSISIFMSCTEDYFIPVQPKLPSETIYLEASYVSSSIPSINSKYWREADYLKVTVVDLSIHNLYDEDGLLNMTGTYDGLNSFNKGNNPELILKAAYDSLNLYILIEWSDSETDASRSSWFWNGKKDPLKPDSVKGWTSQLNDDKVALVFEIESASSAYGPFSDVGCAASCHNGNMKPETGHVDIWKWSLALSEPLGFAFDMHANGDSGLLYDEAQMTYFRNINSMGNNRSGPAYEWNGEVQEIVQYNGKTIILDPAYFLMNKTSFTGDPSKGDSLYVQKGCAGCHGEEGQGHGFIDDGPPLNSASLNRYSRENLISLGSSPNHNGQAYFNKLTEIEIDNVFAKIRGFAGIPGYYITISDLQESDLFCFSNLILGRLEPDNDNYKILLSRKLDTGKEDDVKFEPESGKVYDFGIALMDNDGKNHIGSLIERMIFLEK